ncbi:MAG: OmpA family protein [Flavobacteriaceae bacterium]|jgi:outer membrane protein OmpA-like peptidoglycan-associated protein/tetratricopeptide (TPR) repeat protein|nr:OmpA family protein [Flavobacteriaceae bacterium]
MKIKYLYVIALSFFTVGLLAQERTVNRAGKNYDKLAYIDAAKTYERMANDGYKSVETLQKLGNTYYFNGKLEESAKWFGELFALSEDVEPEYFFRYAQSLKAVGQYQKADEMMKKFNEKSGNDSRGILAKEQKNYLNEIAKNSGRYNIDNAGINSEYSDYGSAFLGEKVVFTSARDTGNFAKRKHSWTGEYFTRLYVADMSEDGSLSEPKKFANELRTRVNESTPVFTKDGKTVYFTRNNFDKGKRGKDDLGNTYLKIYKATLNDDGKWEKITALPFNSDDYQTAHPALSPDEKTLYFASDMPGTLGLSDIFKVSINDDGSFGTPENLGSVINTEGRETFPFISANNEIYFASDGHPGLGGLDIFAAQIKEDGTIKDIHNLGEPANSSYDDFAYIINSGSKRGFLSSNRPNGDGNDDIYKFLETKELQFTCEQILFGIVTDEETGEVLANTKLTLFDEKFNKIKETVSDSEGKYDFGEVECEKKYYVRAEKEEYVTKEMPVIIGKESGETELPIELEKAIKPVQVGDDLAKAFGIKIIYFDLDKWNIRPDASVELAKILDVMREHPNMKIDVRSHTDSRQTHRYNEVLSERRAKSTMNWLISKGIDKSRLTGRGYGETQLVNKCADGVECTEDEHQLNRRSEFIITDL